MSLAEQALSYVRAISPYQPGKPITELAREMGIPVESIVKLASNENPLGMSPAARPELIRLQVAARRVAAPRWTVGQARERRHER